MEKAVIYARYSSDKQTEQSIEGQIRVCEEFAAKHDFQIIGKYIDRAMTGKADKRPDFQRMIKDSHKGLFRHVIVYQFDRFARNIYDNLGYERKLNDNGVKILSAMENMDDNASGRFMRNILLANNQYFSEELAQKVKRGMYEGFVRGYSSGSVVYGYDKVKVNPNNENSKTKKFVANEKEVEVLRGIFADYISGKKIKDIKERLDSEHIFDRKGKPFHKSHVTRFLQNEMYVGTLKFGEHTRENAVPAIIEKEVFLAAQKRLGKNKHTPSAHKAKEFYLLSLKAFCGYCKQLLVGDSGTGKNGTIYRYYVCGNVKRKLKACEKKQVNKKWLEDLVVNATVKHVLTDKMINKAATQLVELNNILEANSRVESLESELKIVISELENLINAIASGLAVNTVKEKVMALEAKKVDLQNAIDEEKLNTPIKLSFEQYVYWFESFKDGDTNDEKFRERLIDYFVNKVILFNDKIIIVYNVKDDNNEKITIEEILEDFNSDSSVFGYEQFGDPTENRTPVYAVKGRCPNR